MTYPRNGRISNAEFELAGIRDPQGLQQCFMMAWENIQYAKDDKAYWEASIRRSPALNRTMDERVKRVRMADAVLKYAV